jgi:hypothetical protein
VRTRHALPESGLEQLNDSKRIGAPPSFVSLISESFGKAHCSSACAERARSVSNRCMSSTELASANPRSDIIFEVSNESGVVKTTARIADSGPGVKRLDAGEGFVRALRRFSKRRHVSPVRNSRRICWRTRQSAGVFRQVHRCQNTVTSQPAVPVP